MLDLQTTEHALTFLGRASLTGDEVPAFVRVSNALQQHRAALLSAQMEPPLPPSKPRSTRAKKGAAPGE